MVKQDHGFKDASWFFFVKISNLRIVLTNQNDRLEIQKQELSSNTI